MNRCAVCEGLGLILLGIAALAFMCFLLGLHA